MENVEMKSMENAPKLLENMAQIPAQSWLLLVLLGACAVGFISWHLTLALIIGGWIALNRVEAKQRLKDAKAMAATYANCIGPIVVSSMHPNETVYEVHARAEFWREQLRLSNNPMADKLPIIELPYTPVLTSYGQFSAGWSTYQRQVGERQHVENVKWYAGKCPAEYKTLFANAVLPPIQQPEQ